jgi:RNA binding exosome subunit
MKVRLLLCGAALASLLAAQDRDFLTPNEVDQVREAQDPNDRLTLYVHFAKQRIDLIEQYLAKEKPGRSIFIHNTLEDYSHIIEAIDSVSDDALRRNREIDKGMIAVVNAEKDFLDRLNKIRDKQPPDLDRYQFVLDDAIDTTSDSRELSMEDSHKRGSELSAEDAKAKKEREAMMPSKEVQDRKKQEGAQSGDQPQKKVPSLYRPGEKHQQP